MKKEFLRFSKKFRFQHIVLFVGCIILILTGLPLRFHSLDMAHGFVDFMGGVEGSRLLHRTGASLLIFVGIYHMFYITLFREGRRDFVDLIPVPRDFLNFFQNIKYFIGFSKERPRFARFSYMEKFDYWAVYWGCVIMIGSGAILWFYDKVMLFLPKWFVDIAKEAHSDEALLATLAIIIWHFYNVHFNPSRFPGSMTWWHGKMSGEEMKEEHPLEYEKMKEEGGKDWLCQSAQQNRRILRSKKDK